ncbi:hypothetical protein J6590_098133, partial [Homalodisca vitripennis]
MKQQASSSNATRRCARVAKLVLPHSTLTVEQVQTRLMMTRLRFGMAYQTSDN